VLELIKIFFFGGMTVLNSDPIVVSDGPTVMRLNQKIEAINCSASFNVDVTEHVEAREYPEFVEEIEAKFYRGCLKVTLNAENGNKVLFDVPSVTWGSPDNVSINLKTTDRLIRESSFETLSIESCVPLSSTIITWYNYGKVSCK